MQSSQLLAVRKLKLKVFAFSEIQTTKSDFSLFDRLTATRMPLEFVTSLTLVSFVALSDCESGYRDFPEETYEARDLTYRPDES